MSAEGTAATVPMPERIGRYRIVRPLSKGGMALVYEGRRESLAGVSPRVAVKVILPDFANSSTFRDLFINEARLGAAMQHQNLVQIQDFDADGERYFIVMEYVEGLTLARIIGLAARHDVRIPLVVICEAGRQACDGLHYAHQAVDTQGRALGLVHRDVKPSNLILNNQGGVKILDFGISKGTLRQEKAGSVKGTWGYMAPEQATGERIGPTADIFALAIVLYEMAARRSMFKGREEEEIRRLLLDDHAARMASTLDAQYAPLVRVLVRALQRDPAARFATAGELGRALSELLPDPITAREETVRFYQRILELHQREKAAPPPPTASRAPTSAVSNVASPAQVGRPGGWGGGSPSSGWGRMVLAALAGALAAGSVAAVGYSLWRARTAPAEVVVPVVEAPVPAPEPTKAPKGPDAFEEPPPERPTPVEPERLAPSTRPRPPEGKPPEPVVDRVVVRGASKDDPQAPPTPGKPPAPAPETTPPPSQPPPATTPDKGWITVSCQQKADIYIDGALVRSHGSKLGYGPGKHVVSFVAPDGRRVQRQVDLKAGQELRLVWDFDLFDWR